MKFSCQHARPLVPSYVDGELSEEQSHPLREHLLDCRDCREVTKDAKSFQRWFVDDAPEGLVPDGFAARIARRAFAGDPGVLMPAAPQAIEEQTETKAGTLLPFLLKASTVAAGLLLGLAIAIQKRGLPESDDLRAETPPPWERYEDPGEMPATQSLSSPERVEDRPAEDESTDEGEETPR